MFIGALVIGAGYLVHSRIQAKGRKARDWPTTSGQVLSSDVAQVSMGKDTMLTPAVAYSYVVNGQSYQGDAIRVGQPPLFNTPSKAQALAAKYPAGSAVTVHYDPASPGAAVLDLAIGEGWTPLMIYAFGATLLGLGLFSAVMHT